MSLITAELHSFELIHCSRHPEFRVEALCKKEGVHPSLLCIKCLLTPEISKETGGELATIKDIIAKSVERKHFSIEIPEISSENLEKRILELSTKNYGDAFEKHIESQMKKLDREIERIKESLIEFRERFVKFFQKQTEGLKTRDMELKKKIFRFFEEKEEMQKMSFNSVSELLRQLRMIYNYEAYEKFIQLLFKKSYSEESGEGSLTKKLINLLDELQSQAKNMKTMRIDTHLLEEIRDKIDSLSIIDKSANIPGVSTLENRLDTTLERLLNFEKRSVEKRSLGRLQGTGTPAQQSLEKKGRESSDKPSPLSEKEIPKTSSSLAQILKDKYGIEPGKKSAPRPHIDQEYPVQKKQFQGEEKIKGTDPGTLKNILNSLKSGKGFPTESINLGAEKPSMFETKPKPYEPTSPFPWTETKRVVAETEKHESRNQMVVENEGTQSNRFEEENTFSAPVIVKEPNFFHYRPKSVDKGSRPGESSGFSSTAKSSVNQGLDRVRTQPQFSPAQSYKSSQYPSYQQQEQQRQLQQPRGDPYRRSSTSPGPRDFPRSDEQVWNSPKFSKNTERQSNYVMDSQEASERGRANTQSQGKEFRSSQSQEYEENSHAKGKTSLSKTAGKESAKSIAVSENSRDKLINEWIDHKVNGFLVFQNSVKDEAPAHTEDFSRYCSDKWFHLSKAERDEYTVLALGVRSELKQELKELALTTSDLSQLQQLLDERIKQVKK